MNEKLINIRGTKSQVEFANILDVTPQWLSKLENGKFPVSRKLARKLSKRFGKTSDYWRGLADE